MIGSAEAVLDGDLPRSEVDQVRRTEEETDSPRPPFVQRDGRLGDSRQASDTGADQHAGRVEILLRSWTPAGSRYRHFRRRHGRYDEGNILTRFLLLDQVVCL